MIQKIKYLLFTISTVLTLSLPAIVPSVASAADNTSGAGVNLQGGLCQGSNLDVSNTNGANCDTVTTNDFQTTLATIINIISIIVGVVAVIMIIFGGFRYITSGGASEKVTNAKNTILYGIIGLIIVALAQIIVKFVLNQATKAVG